MTFTLNHYILEVLAQIGIVRPSFLRALLEARNAVEYRDHKPPRKKRCQELADSVWYFLRSTDSLVVMQREVIELNPRSDEDAAEPYWLSLEMTYSSRFRMQVHGWLPAQLVRATPNESWIEIAADDFRMKKERRSNEAEDSEHKDDDYWIRGVVALDVGIISSLLTLVFAAE